MKILLLRSAQKQLDKIEGRTALKISRRILELGQNPYLPGFQKLKGGMGYRIRTGKYRVIYSVNITSQTITVIKIAHRKEVYR